MPISTAGTLNPSINDRADTMIRIAIKLVSDVLAGVVGVVVAQVLHESEMSMQVDQRRHDRLPRQVDHGCTLGNAGVGCQSDGGDDAIVDEQYAPAERRAAVASDQRGALEGHDGASWFFRFAPTASGEPEGEPDNSRNWSVVHRLRS